MSAIRRRSFASSHPCEASLRFEDPSCEAGEAEAYRKQVVRARVRRGQARAALGLMPEAEADYVEALKWVPSTCELVPVRSSSSPPLSGPLFRLDPGNESLASDLEELRAALGPADAANLRQRGNARFQAKDYLGAVEAFSLLLESPPQLATATERLAALSNRAACLLVLERYQDAAEDCGAALEIHLAEMKGGDAAGSEGLGEGDPGPLPVPVLQATGSSPLVLMNEWATGIRPGSWPFGQARALQLSRLLARRGAAHAHLKRFEESVLDYESAAAFAGFGGESARQQELKADADKLSALLDAGQTEKI